MLYVSRGAFSIPSPPLLLDLPAGPARPWLRVLNLQIYDLKDAATAKQGGSVYSTALLIRTHGKGVGKPAQNPATQQGFMNSEGKRRGRWGKSFQINFGGGGGGRFCRKGLRGRPPTVLEGGKRLWHACA